MLNKEEFLNLIIEIQNVEVELFDRDEESLGSELQEARLKLEDMYRQLQEVQSCEDEENEDLDNEEEDEENE
jgi:hypothetical protein